MSPQTSWIDFPSIIQADLNIVTWIVQWYYFCINLMAGIHKGDLHYHALKVSWNKNKAFFFLNGNIYLSTSFITFIGKRNSTDGSLKHNKQYFKFNMFKMLIITTFTVIYFPFFKFKNGSSKFKNGSWKLKNGSHKFVTT